MKSFKKLFVILLALTMVLSFAACGGNSSEEESAEPASEEKVIVYGLDSAWNRLMPYDMLGMYSIIPCEKIFDRLCGFDNENIIYYRAAESIDVSDDLKTYTVHLRQDSKWHDGEPVTAYDWEWTFKTMSQPEFEGYGSRGYLAPFEGVDASGTGDIQIKALDDYTLEMHLKDASTPEAFFGSYSYYYYVLPKHLLEDIPVAELGTHEFWNNPIGSGPCKFVSETPGYEVVLEAFDDYYLGRPQFDKLIYRVQDAAAKSANFLAGDIDLSWDTVAAEEANTTLKDHEGLHLELMENVVNVMLTINNEKFPAKVRHAIDMAIDKQLIVDSICKGYGQIATSMLMPSSPYYNNDLEFVHDPETAKKTLEEEGFDFSQTYTIGAGNESRQKVAAIIQSSLAEIGIQTEIITGDSSSLIAGSRDGSIDMVILQSTTGASPTFLINSFAANTVTYSRVQDNKYYEMHVAVNQATDLEERIELAKEMQKVIFEESPYIWLYDQEIYMVCSDKISNVTVANNDKCWEWVVN